MEATKQAREQEKKRLLGRLATLMVEQQAEEGMFQTVPHFSALEGAARAVGQEVSRAIQERAAAKVAALCKPRVECPMCGKEHPVKEEMRTVTGPDGPVELIEPVAHCPEKRRDFFPSA